MLDLFIVSEFHVVPSLDLPLLESAQVLWTRQQLSRVEVLWNLQESSFFGAQYSEGSLVLISSCLGIRVLFAQDSSFFMPYSQTWDDDDFCPYRLFGLLRLELEVDGDSGRSNSEDSG
ncbi:hypothetical protein C2S51_030081 [Perilla frutescens var. frutescens]|nr:hypothetical protein C2S51_030081 [Perilla frutescens var. frutescens]